MNRRRLAADDAGFTLPELLVTTVIVGVIIAAVGATMIIALRHHAEPGRTLGPSNDANLLSSYFTADVESASVSDTTAGAASGCSYVPPAGVTNVVALSWTDNVPAVPVSRAVAYQLDAAAATLTRVACVSGEAPTLATVAHHVLGATAAVDTAVGAIDLDVSARAADAALSDAPFSFQLRAYGRLSGSGNGGAGTGSGTGRLNAGEVLGAVAKYTDQAGTAGATPLGGMTVSLSQGATVVATARTDASGKYYFGTLEPGDYGVALAANGMAATDGSSLSGTVTVGADATETRQFKVWTPVGMVSGLARLAAGTPMANVAVSIAPASGPAVGSTTTNAAGQFSFGNLTLGSYAVTLTPPSGYADVSGATCSANVVDPTPVACPDAVFDVSPGSIAGTVKRDVDLNGTGDTAMAGVVVTVNQGATVVGNATSDASGAVTFTGLGAGTYTVTETVSGFTPVTPLPVTVTVTAGGTANVALVNQAPCGLTASQPVNTVSLKGNKTPNNNQTVSVRTDGRCNGAVTIVFGAGSPGPASALMLTAGSPSGTGPFTYTAPVPTGNPTWSSGTATATVKVNGTSIGTIQVTVS